MLPLAPMPERPTLADFFMLRFAPRTVTHLLQSATDALRKGQPEQGLGFDGSPVARMWRSLIYPENPL